MSEVMPMMIHRFYTKYVDDKNNLGKKKPLDYVEYGPIGSAGRTHVVDSINRISKVSQNAGANPAVMMSKSIWDFIRPRYEAWKNNQDMPEAGTPLAAWNALTPEQAEILRVNGVKTVENMAVLTDAHITRIPIPNMRSLIQQAKVFLSAQDSNRFSAEMKAKDDRMNELEAQNADLLAKVDKLATMVAETRTAPEPNRGGRPKGSKNKPKEIAVTPDPDYNPDDTADDLEEKRQAKAKAV